MLFGRGSTGGNINQISKQARLITGQEVNAMVGINHYRRYQDDFNFKLEGEAALRLNAMATDSNGRGDSAGASTHRRGLALDNRLASAQPTNSRSATTTCITTTSPTGVSSG